MPLYHYKARDKEGRDAVGDKDAKDQYELSHALHADGLTVISITEANIVKRKKLSEYIPTFFQSIWLEEKMNFTSNIAVMIGAGLSLTRALEVMSRQTANARFKAVVLAMTEIIKQGKTLSDALGMYPAIFPTFFQEMVRAGEKSGKLEDALKLTALQFKKDYALTKKVRSAMIYPVIIMCAMIGIGIVLLIYVVPTLVKTFKELNVQLPVSTQLIIYVSESIVERGLILFLGTAGIAYGLYRWLRSPKSKFIKDWIFIHAPVIGAVNQKFNAARTCRTLSSLISSGVNIVEALSVTEGVLQNHAYQNVVKSAKEKIQKGETISRAFLSAEGLYPVLVGEMMSVGEETGELARMLMRLAAFYENEVSVATKDLSAIIEPLMMIIIGVVVGFFAISMISPMYNLAGAF